jgi:hypothetical protein
VSFLRFFGSLQLESGQKKTEFDQKLDNAKSFLHILRWLENETHPTSTSSLMLFSNFNFIPAMPPIDGTAEFMMIEAFMSTSASCILLMSISRAGDIFSRFISVFTSVLLLLLLASTASGDDVVALLSTSLFRPFGVDGKNDVSNEPAVGLLLSLPKQLVNVVLGTVVADVAAVVVADEVTLSDSVLIIGSDFRIVVVIELTATELVLLRAALAGLVLVVPLFWLVAGTSLPGVVVATADDTVVVVVVASVGLAVFEADVTAGGVDDWLVATVVVVGVAGSVEGSADVVVVDAVVVVVVLEAAWAVDDAVVVDVVVAT